MAAATSHADPTAPRGQPDWLLPTKLAPPPPRLRLVPRPRLLTRLDEGLLSPLTLLVAPAGSGKTTLVSEWLATPAGAVVPLAWLSLDEGDNDPIRFWTYAVAAIRSARPGRGDGALALLGSPRPPLPDAVVAALIRDLAGLDRDLVLVLDDYHAVEAEAVHHSLRLLLDRRPPRLHLWLTSRSEPPLGLSRLRARGELVEVRAADLRFADDEAAAFLADVMGLALPSPTSRRRPRAGRPGSS